MLKIVNRNAANVPITSKIVFTRLYAWSNILKVSYKPVTKSVFEIQQYSNFAGILSAAL